MTFNTDFLSIGSFNTQYPLDTELIIIRKYAEHLPFPLSLQKKAKSHDCKRNYILYCTKAIQLPDVFTDRATGLPGKFSINLMRLKQRQK